MARRQIEGRYDADGGGDNSDHATRMAVVLPGDEEERAAAQEKSRKYECDDDVAD